MDGVEKTPIVVVRDKSRVVARVDYSKFGQRLPARRRYIAAAHRTGKPWRKAA